MPLTDSSCRTARPAAKPYKLSDGGGLQLWVHTSGSRTWRIAYRFRLKQRTLYLGVYPSMTLAEARSGREDVKKSLRQGVDPAAAIQKPAADDSARLFRTVATAWFDGAKAAWVKSHGDRVWSRLEADIFPEIGDRDMTTLEPPDILALVRKVEARGALDMARRVKQTVGSVYKYAIAAGIARTNPSRDIEAALKPKPKVKHLAALKEKDLLPFFEKLRSYDGHALTRYALLLTIQTMVRTNETRFAKWDEFEGLKGSSPLWRISPERMKMDREHLVPLSKQTVELLSEIRRLTGQYDLLFPAPSKKGVMSENTMLYALYRMGYHSRATVHGFRGTASTVLNEHGWNSDWIERQLAHDEEDEVRASYNSAEYLPGRRNMVQWWCDFIQ